MFSYQDNKGKIPRVLQIKETNIRPQLFTSGDIYSISAVHFVMITCGFKVFSLMRLFIIFVLSTQHLTPSYSWEGTFDVCETLSRFSTPNEYCDVAAKPVQ